MNKFALYIALSIIILVSYTHAMTLVCNAKSGSSFVSVAYSHGKWCAVDGSYVGGNLVATAKWIDTIQDKGWGQLKVTTAEVLSKEKTSSFSNDPYELSVYGAGYAEGVSTQHRIWQMLKNSNDGELGSQLRAFFSQHIDYLKDSIQTNSKNEYWRNVNYVLYQMEGLLAGYMSVAPEDEAIDILDIMRLNMDGDRFALEDALDRGYTIAIASSSTENLVEVGVEVSSKRGTTEMKSKVHQVDVALNNLIKLRQDEEKLLWSKLMADQESRHMSSRRVKKKDTAAIKKTAKEFESRYELQHLRVMKAEEEAWRQLVRKGHCTAIVKLTDDNSDILIAHTSWEGYNEMLRIYKHYDIKLPNAPGRKISFSSYPGILSSTDDWYITSAGLAIMETTIELVDKRILHYVAPDVGVASWIRSIVASRMASSGEEWVKLYGSENSGTYNCQWMVIDYNLFKPNMKHLQPGTFYVLESIPNYVHYEDMTHFLEDNLVFPSANRPIFDGIRNHAGYPRERIGGGEDFFSFGNNPRHEIIFRDSGSIHDIEDMKHLIRKNDYKNDPFSHGQPDEAIAARYDLGLGGMLSGAVDAKVTGYKGVQSLTCQIIAGPTTENGLPPFDFSDYSNEGLHEGMPDRWNFDWFEVSFDS